MAMERMREPSVSQSCPGLILLDDGACYIELSDGHVSKVAPGHLFIRPPANGGKLDCIGCFELEASGRNLALQDRSDLR